MTPFIVLVIAGGIMIAFVFTGIVIIAALDNCNERRQTKR